MKKIFILLMMLPVMVLVGCSKDIDEPENYNKKTVETFTVKGVSFNMVNVIGGTFMMGSENGRYIERPVHQVTVSNFSIGQTEVTQELWQAVMGSNPSEFNGYGNPDYGSDHSEYYGINLKRPVESVSWNDCQEFIDKLNQMTGKNFRLPTEAEWEYAARGGNNSKGYVFAGSNTIDDVAWYGNNNPSPSGNPDYGTQTVATKKPNELGIYDMSGNVREWCLDWYRQYYSSALINPTGPSSGRDRVVRGGGWFSLPIFCQVSFRDFSSPDFRGYGLRLAASDNFEYNPDIPEERMPNTIESVWITPEVPTSFDEVVVTAKVSGLLSVTKAVLRYSINDDFVGEINMKETGANTFTATIPPAQEDGDKVNYSVIITNEAGYTTTFENNYTVVDKPSDFTKLVINEVCGAGGDGDKYLELYNNGNDPIKLKGVVIKKDEADEVWVGEDGEVIMGQGYFVIAGAKNVLGEGGSGPNPRPMTKGLTAKKNVLMEVYDPNGNFITKFQRGDAGEEGWNNGSSYNGLPYTENRQTWSRCPNGTGKFMVAPGSKGTKNPDVGEEDLTVVQ